MVKTCVCGFGKRIFLREGLDACLIMRLRDKPPVTGEATAVGERTHEARSQDVVPDGRTSGRMRSDRRSPGSRLGRWIDSAVPA